MLAIATLLPQLRPPPCDSTKSQSCNKADGFQMGILYMSLYVIAIGTGGLKSSVSGFRSDQFDEKDKKEKAQMTLFCSRFYFFISIGTLVAVTFLVYIQDEVSRSLGYGICSVSMLGTILIFLGGSKRYRYKKSLGSPVIDIIQVIIVAFRKRNLKYPSNTNLFYEDTAEDSRINHTNQFQRVLGQSCNYYRKPQKERVLSKFLDTSTMNRSMGDFQIPSGSLTVFVGAILISLGVYDRVIAPVWRKWKGRPGFTSLQRISIGLVFSIIGMATAAVVERRRLSVAKDASSTNPTLPITVFILIPQFFLIGWGEGYIYSGQLDFFITQISKRDEDNEYRALPHNTFTWLFYE